MENKTPCSPGASIASITEAHLSLWPGEIFPLRLNWGLERSLHAVTGSPGPLDRGLTLMHVASSQGMLVGIVGKVGCGKSSLLAAITGELHR